MISWWGLALIVSFVHAVIFNLNKKFQLDGLRARAWISFFAGLFLSPSLFLINIPHAWGFYACIILGGLLMSYIGALILDLSAQYGGPIASLGRPLQILFSFVVWAALTPVQTMEMLSSPWVAAGVVFSFALAAYGQWRMMSESVDLKSVGKILILLGFMMGLLGPVTKYGMGYTVELSQVLVWACLFHFSVFFTTLLRYPLKAGRPRFIDARTIKIAAGFGVFQGGFGYFMPLAFHLSPNPAFVTLIVMLSTVWLMIYYALRQHEAHIRPRTVALLLAAAAILIMTTEGM